MNEKKEYYENKIKTLEESKIKSFDEKKEGQTITTFNKYKEQNLVALSTKAKLIKHKIR